MTARYAFCLVLFFVLGPLEASEWVLKSPRPELAIKGSLGADGELILQSDSREGLNGFWEKRFSVEGAQWVRFQAWRKAANVFSERRSCVVRIEWEGEQGEPVESPRRVNPAYFGSEVTRARPDFPRDKGRDKAGRVEVSDVYPVPKGATTAIVQLHLRWAPSASVSWHQVSLEEVEAPSPRRVKLAAVHTRLAGGGRSVAENREIFRPFIEEAAKASADLIVLPELLTCKGVTQDYASVAEPIPGPTTDYFAALSKEHDCYLVVGMVEREKHLIYNVAVLLGPEGEVVGKYRKVTLPREEIARGISPGNEYPVFQTRFGQVGMMICYDVFFPEVARELAMNGAEIIALPIWGGNPRLAGARCAENGVFLISSTYTDHSSDWMKTAIWNREGDRLVTADHWESVIVEEVDLNEPTYWHGLGDFQSRIRREAPLRRGELRIGASAKF